MGKIVGFQSEHDARRVIRAVKKLETPGILGRDGGRWDHNNNVIVAKITADDGGLYSWEQQRATSDGETESAGIVGTADVGYALDLSDIEPDVGDVVTLVRVALHNDDDTFDLVWAISSGPPPKGQYQFMVYQMVADSQRGFDFVRAHPIL